MKSPIGFLAGTRTLVTTCRTPRGERCGPICAWDTETGTLRANHFGVQDIFVRIRFDPQRRTLLIQQESPGSRFGYRDFDLRVIDPLSGSQRIAFRSRVSSFGTYWTVSDDGRISAHRDMQRIEWHDIALGLIGTLPARGDGMWLSSDGSRLAVATPSKIIVLELPSGREVAQLDRPMTPTGKIGPMCFSSDSRLLIDTQAGVWDLRTGSAVSLLRQTRFFRI
jgi:hypothetical protein